MKTLQACEKAGVEINWWEEVLHPDDFDGHVKLKEALPYVKFTTGEHEYSKYVHSFYPSPILIFRRRHRLSAANLLTIHRYGFRKLIENRAVDIIQPDVMWLGGLTELIKVAA